MLMTKKTKITMKPPPQSPSAPVSNLVFEGVYNNARMLHFLTAVVGSTCDVRVKNGSVYEGVFKTLSSECELAVDAVHKLSDGGGGVVDEGGGAPGRPHVEDITDTMVFSPSDLVTMTCRDVDLSFAVRDSFSDPSIGSARLNGDHREKVLQRWDGDGNGENYELESETSNGWDANDMFKFNEDTYGVKSTYDSSLSSYTMPLERGNSEVFRQREARAARLANEIESSAQYRRRVSLENDEGRSDEDKYSAVVREQDDRGGASTRSEVTRNSKYVPLPQRTRDVMRGGASSRPSAPPTSSPKPASDRSSPLSIRPVSSSPPFISHALPHSLSHPQALNDSSHVNGVSSRTSPQSHCPQLNRTQNRRTLVSQSSPAGPDSDPSDRTSGPVPAALTRLVVPSASQTPKLDIPPHLDSSPSVTTVTSSSSSLSGPAPLFPVDVNEILNSASKDRTDCGSGSGSGSGPQDGKNSRVPLVQQRSQLEELRKFGKEFRLQSSLSSVDLPPPPDSTFPPKPFDLQPSAEMAPPTSLPAAAVTPPSSGSEVSQSRTPQSAPLSSDESSLEINERTEAATAATTQVKNSTLNPNAKEFQPVKGHSAVKSASAPPPPRPTPPSPSVVLNSSPPAGQPGGGAIYSGPPGPYLSYVSPLSLQGQLYQYAMSTVTQGKYPRPKGAVVSSRPDHASSSSSIISAASAGPPLVSPYTQSYLQYGHVIQTVAPPYHGQTVYSMLHGGARLLTSGAPPPQTMGPPGQQYPGPTEGPGCPQQGLYAAQSFSHHSGAIHHPQPSSTPTGTQAPPQHPAPSPGHSQSQTGQAPPPSMFHSGPLSTPTPLGHASAQSPYPVQGYSLNPHQTLAHGFTSISQITQAHVSAGLTGPHHPTGHGHPPVMLHYAPPQQVGGSTPQQGAPQHFYIGPHQAVQVQSHPSQTLTFHPSAN